jgi:hypothetical protein
VCNCAAAPFVTRSLPGVGVIENLLDRGGKSGEIYKEDDGRAMAQG